MVKQWCFGCSGVGVVSKFDGPSMRGRGEENQDWLRPVARRRRLRYWRTWSNAPSATASTTCRVSRLAAVDQHLPHNAGSLEPFVITRLSGSFEEFQSPGPSSIVG